MGLWRVAETVEGNTTTCRVRRSESRRCRGMRSWHRRVRTIRFNSMKLPHWIVYFLIMIHRRLLNWVLTYEATIILILRIAKLVRISFIFAVVDLIVLKVFIRLVTYVRPASLLAVVLRSVGTVTEGWQPHGYLLTVAINLLLLLLLHLFLLLLLHGLFPFHVHETLTRQLILHGSESLMLRQRT